MANQNDNNILGSTVGLSVSTDAAGVPQPPQEGQAADAPDLGSTDPRFAEMDTDDSPLNAAQVMRLEALEAARREETDNARRAALDAYIPASAAPTRRAAARGMLTEVLALTM